MCTSVNNVACHGIPDLRPLRNGDIINIDITVSFFLNDFSVYLEFIIKKKKSLYSEFNLLVRYIPKLFSFYGIRVQ